jgi:hypothetical protein
MSAKNGSAVSCRKRGRLIGCSVAVVFALSAVFAAGAGAVNPPVTKSYLALGDSVAFGYSQQLFNENYPGEPASAYEHGYARYYFLHLKPLLTGTQTHNNGCPKETTDSMIGDGPLAAALGIPGESACPYHKLGFPLHHEYGAGKSQLENAVETIALDAGAGKPVTTITLNIGANDQLNALTKCKTEVGEEWKNEGKSAQYGGENPTQSFEKCVLAHVNALFAHIVGNLDRILYVLRNGATFGGVNYTGKIILLGGYDPYGVVFKLGEFGFGTGKELINNSNALTATLNGIEKKNVTDSGDEAAKEGHEPFEVCFANPQARFNPQNKYEPARLQKLTNMANFTEFGGKKYGEPGANGPDIHPTLAGYKALTSIMVVACG